MPPAAPNALSDTPSETARIAALQALVSEDAQLQARAERIRQLEEIIRSFQRKTFCASSEQPSTAQLGLFNEAEANEATEAPEVVVKPHARQHRGRPALPAELPLAETVDDMDALLPSVIKGGDL